MPSSTSSKSRSLLLGQCQSCYPPKLFQREYHSLPLLFFLPFSRFPFLPTFYSHLLFRFFPCSILPSPSCFVVHHGDLNKVYPFTPLPRALCVNLLNTHRYHDESIELEVEEILGALRGMTNVDNLARDYLA